LTRASGHFGFYATRAAVMRSAGPAESKHPLLPCIFCPAQFDPYQQTITLLNVTIEPVIVLTLASDQSDLFKGHDNDNSG
tara:strand:- start:47 stop:286 length:240 start_codon:yes stop_codon:yes gene_type:complete